jgi:hypothetical protein
MNLKDELIYAISIYNDDKEANPEYLRGQVELAMFLLDAEHDDENTYLELQNAADLNPMSVAGSIIEQQDKE